MNRIMSFIRRVFGNWQIWLVIVFALGVFLRYFQLADVPQGYFHDEAWTDVKAAQILTGELRSEVYLTDNNGVDAMHVFLLSLLFKLTGPIVVGTRIISSLGGALIILATYWTACEIFAGHPRKHLVALTAAFVNATVFWALTTSRTGLFTVWMALFVTSAVAALLRARRVRQHKWYFFAGLLAGLSQYTYHAARFLPLLVAIIFAEDLIRNRSTRWAIMKNYTLLVVTAVIVYSPVLYAFAQNPAPFVLRAQETVIQPADLGPNIIHTLLGISFVGDVEGLHNLAGRPQLDPILSTLFVVGLAVSFWKVRDKAMLCLIWLVVFTLPVVLTSQAPVLRRWTGVMAPESVLIAAGALSIAQAIRSRLPRVWARPLAVSVVGGMLLASAGLSISDYFGPYAHNPQIFWIQDSGITQVAQYISEQTDMAMFLTPYDKYYEVVDATLAEAHHTPIQSYNGQVCALFPRVTDQPAEWVVVTEQDSYTIPTLQQLFAKSEIVWSLKSPIGDFASALRVPPGQSAQLNLINQAQVTFGSQLQLIGFSGIEDIQRGQALRLMLAVEDVQPLDRLYKFFVHVRGADTSIIAQDDRYPCDYSLNQADWLPGNVVLQNFEVMIPADVLPGRYALELGAYDPDSGARLPIGQSNLVHDPDQVTLGIITVR